MNTSGTRPGDARQDDVQAGDVSTSGVIALLQRGELALAGKALDRLQAREGDQPRIAYLRGLLLLAGDQDRDARPLLATAAQAFPDDAAIQANWSLCLQRLGETDAALEASDRVIALAPGHADGHYNRGLLLVALNRFDDAAAALRNAARLAPGRAQCWQQLAEVEHRQGRYLEAELAWQRALALQPQDAAMLGGLAGLYYDAGMFEASLEATGKALAVDPDSLRALLQRSSALRRLGRLEESEEAIGRVLHADPLDAQALKARGLVCQMQDRLDEAAADFVASARLRFAPGTNIAPVVRELRRTSKAKLRHDVEQFHYLAELGAFEDGTAEALIEDHEHALEQLPAQAGHAQVVELPAGALRRLAGRYNRLHHLEPAPRLSPAALHPALDGARIEADYAARGPGITWIDDFLSAEALASLRRYCLGSTFWFDFHHANGYLGAYFEDGFAAPLLLQLAEELRQRMPAIFRDHVLTQLWAYKYDSQLDGIELHADIAAVNLNFWITPDEANLDPETGGLVVWDKEAPPEWAFDEYNTSTATGQARIERFLHDAGASAVRIPYRTNRAVLFNSDLFHRTDRIRFREGYENRRINITMLFGRRDGLTR